MCVCGIDCGLRIGVAWRRTCAEVVDSNPYSRLMALQRMGIVDNYERIRDYSVAIVVSISLLSGCEALLRKQFELAIGIEQTCNFPL